MQAVSKHIEKLKTEINYFDWQKKLLDERKELLDERIKDRERQITTLQEHEKTESTKNVEKEVKV